MTKRDNGRFTGLDSLRGIAACIVVLNHLQLLLLPGNVAPWLMETPLRLLVNGRLAVLAFFVLSGFVLTLPIMSGRYGGYSDFMIKRVCRVYLPFLFVMVFSILMWRFTYNAAFSDVVHWNDWEVPVDWKHILGHVFMIGVEDQHSLNPPMWTLILEMRVSLIFPLLVIFCRKVGFWALPISIVVGYISAKAYNLSGGGTGFYVAENGFGAIALTLYYVQYFIMGILLAIYRETVVKYVSKIPTWSLLMVTGAALAIPVEALNVVPYLVKELWYGFLAAGLVGMIMANSWVNKKVSVQPFHYLGKISYSLYLIHSPIILGMAYLFAGTLSMWVIALGALPLVILASVLTHHFIEMPAKDIGSALTRKLRKRRAKLIASEGLP